MTAQHDSNSGANAENGQGAVSPSTPMPARRRILVRGAAAAVPTILTLHSGSAVAARTSFLISKASGAPVDNAGRNMCLDLRSVKEELAPNVYDLGDPPSPEVTYIRTTESYYREQNESSATVSPMEMCESGGDYYVKTTGGGSTSTTTGSDRTVRVSSPVDASADWNKVTVQKGVLVSATALSSFVGRVIIREI